MLRWLDVQFLLGGVCVVEGITYCLYSCVISFPHSNFFSLFEIDLLWLAILCLGRPSSSFVVAVVFLLWRFYVIVGGIH